MIFPGLKKIFRIFVSAMKNIKIALFTISFLFFAGCCTYKYRIYSEELSSKQSCTLELPQVKNTLLKVDGKIVDYEKVVDETCFHPKVTIVMQPGRHLIEWSFELVSSSSFHTYKTPFQGDGILDAKPNEKYHIVYDYLYCDCGSLIIDYYSAGSYEFYKQLVELKDTATWIEKKGFGALRTDIVVAGKRPSWVDVHSCADCGQKKAKPCKYHCEDCVIKIRKTKVK